VFHMFRPFQDATLLPTDLKAPEYEHGGVSVPAISMSAAQGSDGAIFLALANLDPKSVSALSVSINGAHPKHVTGEILTAAAMDARNTFESPETVHPTAFSGAALKGGTLSVTLPAKSVVVLRLE
jgi:alpha-L-arabinofuranosidase